MDNCCCKRGIINTKNIECYMKIKNRLKAAAYLLSTFWTVWIIFKSYPTKCFSYFDTYLTLITLLTSMILNDLMG